MLRPAIPVLGVPVTSDVQRVYPFQVLVPDQMSGPDLDSRAQAEQMRSVSLDKLGERLGSSPAPLMLEVDEALRLHLSL